MKFVILKEESRLRVFKCRVLRNILEPKEVKVTGGWRTLHNWELHDCYSSLNISLDDQIKEDEMCMACGTYGGWQKSLRFLYHDPFGGKT
jgi:hypothetical protein